MVAEADIRLADGRTLHAYDTGTDGIASSPGLPPQHARPQAGTSAPLTRENLAGRRPRVTGGLPPGFACLPGTGLGGHCRIVHRLARRSISCWLTSALIRRAVTTREPRAMFTVPVNA